MLECTDRPISLVGEYLFRLPSCGVVVSMAFRLVQVNTSTMVSKQNKTTNEHAIEKPMMASFPKATPIKKTTITKQTTENKAPTSTAPATEHTRESDTVATGKTTDNLAQVSTSTMVSKQNQTTNEHAIDKPMMASLPKATPIKKTTITKQTIGKTAEKQKKTIEATKKKKNILPIPIQATGIINKTIPKAPVPTATFETPAKTPHHPTRSFPIPPAPADNLFHITSPFIQGTRGTPNTGSASIPLMEQSPMRALPFTTSLVPKPIDKGQEATQSRGFSSNNNSSHTVASQIGFLRAMENLTTPTKTLPMPDNRELQIPSPILYYQDPSILPAIERATVPEIAQASPSPVHEAMEQQPHVSEPPMDNEEFPPEEDPTEPMQAPADNKHESDEGYATANDDEVNSDMETTTGSQSQDGSIAGRNTEEASVGDTTAGDQTQDGTTTGGNPDDASIEETTTGSQSHDGSTTVDNQEEQSVGDTTTATEHSKSAGQSLSRRSGSSGEETNATNVTAATPPRNNRTDQMECDSDDEESIEDANLACPHPEHFRTYWRADYVTSVPTNTNPILAVAAKLGETLAMLQTIDTATSVYPYEYNPKLKPIQDPAEFATLGTDLYSYADKNNLWKYPKKEMKTCRLILCLAMNSDFRNTCEAFNRMAEDAQLYPRALNYPRIGRVLSRSTCNEE
jgi:hypothetical protein